MKNSTNTKSLTKSPLSKSILSHSTIASIMKQILSALAYMNNKGFFHRDIKPEVRSRHSELCSLSFFCVNIMDVIYRNDIILAP